MSKYLLKYGAIVVIGFLAIFFIYRSCSLYTDFGVLKGKYDTLRQETQDNAKKAQEIIENQQKKIEELLAHEKEIQKSIDEKSEKIKNLSLLGETLEKQEKEITNKDELIVNLRQQIDVWKQKFSLATAIIDDKDKIIFSLTERYESAMVIAEQYKGMYERTAELNRLAEIRIKGLERSLKRGTFERYVTRAVVLGLGGLVVYDRFLGGGK